MSPCSPLPFPWVIVFWWELKQRDSTVVFLLTCFITETKMGNINPADSLGLLQEDDGHLLAAQAEMDETGLSTGLTILIVILCLFLLLAIGIIVRCICKWAGLWIVEGSASVLGVSHPVAKIHLLYQDIAIHSKYNSSKYALSDINTLIVTST